MKHLNLQGTFSNSLHHSQHLLLRIFPHLRQKFYKFSCKFWHLGLDFFIKVADADTNTDTNTDAWKISWSLAHFWLSYKLKDRQRIRVKNLAIALAVAQS